MTEAKQKPARAKESGQEPTPATTEDVHRVVYGTEKEPSELTRWGQSLQRQVDLIKTNLANRPRGMSMGDYCFVFWLLAVVAWGISSTVDKGTKELRSAIESVDSSLYLVRDSADNSAYRTRNAMHEISDDISRLEAAVQELKVTLMVEREERQAAEAAALEEKQQEQREQLEAALAGAVERIKQCMEGPFQPHHGPADCFGQGQTILFDPMGAPAEQQLQDHPHR